MKAAPPPAPIQPDSRAATPSVMPANAGIHDLPSCGRRTPGCPPFTGMSVRVPAKSRSFGRLVLRPVWAWF